MISGRSPRTVHEARIWRAQTRPWRNNTTLVISPSCPTPLPPSRWQRGRFRPTRS